MPEAHEVLDVDRTHQQRQQAGRAGHPGQAADYEEQVEPGGHEGEVHQPGEGHEHAADQRHPPAVRLMHEQREQEEQHEEGAGVESVHSCDHHGQQR